jgi:hypothetical protein
MEFASLIPVLAQVKWHYEGARAEREPRVADRSLQMLGGMGVTRDTVVERIFRDTRAFRIYDGPNEVHRCAPAGFPRILTQYPDARSALKSDVEQWGSRQAY